MTHCGKWPSWGFEDVKPDGSHYHWGPEWGDGRGWDCDGALCDGPAYTPETSHLHRDGCQLAPKPVAIKAGAGAGGKQ